MIPVTARRDALLSELEDSSPLSETIRFSVTDLVRYAGASGDFNPLHHDDEHARALGFPGVIAMGLLPGGVLGVRLRRWVGAERLQRLRLRFEAPVLPKSDYTIAARVVGPASGPDPVVEVEMTIDDPSGRTAVRATAWAVARDED